MGRRLAQNAHTLWLTQAQTEKRRLLNLLQSNCTFDGTNLTATYKKPFCSAIEDRRAEGPVSSVWRGLQDDFMNFFRSEACREMAERVA